MFYLINKFYQNKQTNHKKEKPSLTIKNKNQFMEDLNGFDDFIDISKNKSLNKSIIKENNFNDCNKNEFLNEFAKSIFTIILDSRKNKINNIININNNFDNSNKSHNKSFNIDIDELFLYNDFYQKKTDIQKFVIEFYLIKNKNNKIIKELVEKWKFSYKLNDNWENKNNIDINYLKNKISILKKSIISYSRLLPLYQYAIDNQELKDYSIEFKFYHNNSKKKGIFKNAPSGNVLLKNPNLFSFKMNIKYYSEKEIKNIFDETNDYIDINTTKNKSLSFHKSNKSINGYEGINNHRNGNNPINNEENDNLNEIKTCQTTIINNNKLNDLDSISDDSPFFLNIYEHKEEDNKNNKNNNKINLEFDNSIDNKKIDKNIKEGYDNTCKRKCSIFSNSNETTEDCTPRNSDLKINENKEISPYIKKILSNGKNKEMNNIFKEYNLLKDMMENFPSFTNIKTKKLMTYMDVFE